MCLNASKARYLYCKINLESSTCLRDSYQVDKPVYIKLILHLIDRLVYNEKMKTIKIPQPKNLSTLSARDRILITAHDLFYDHGVRATGIDLIIATAKVTKTTFYRHFPSKHQLIIAFLHYRHEKWITWFNDAIKRNGNNINAICPALNEWFTQQQYRGCAFINTVAELAEELPEVVEISKNHKQEMNNIIEQTLSNSTEVKNKKELAAMIGLSIDGAIIQTQNNKISSAPLLYLQKIINRLTLTC